MNKPLYKIISLLLFVIGYATVPLYAQNAAKDPLHRTKQSFIHKGEILTGFSFFFSNASGKGYGFNSGIPNETTNTTIQLNGLYFISDHVGVGPLLGYQFYSVDWGQNQGGTAHRGLFEFGAQGSYYTPLSDIFGGSSSIYFL